MLTYYCLSVILRLRVIKFGDYFFDVQYVVQIKTFWLDVRYPQHVAVRE